MSFDLYAEETGNRLAGLRPVKEPEPGMFDNFLAGSGQIAMQTFAKSGRAAGMALAPAAIGLDKAKAYFNDTGPSTEIQDKFFKAHDDIFGRAVDYWTPKPNEVGAAGQVVGQLLGTLPQVFASPALTVAATQLSTGEDLVRKGVDAGTAQAVGGVQAAGLGLGIWVPILGQTLAQRVLLGGAGFNVAQGLATRAASAELLEGTPGAEDFKALDPTALTLDVLLGAAFGGIAHINPRMRAEGDAWHKRIAEWGKTVKPSEVDALAALRQAQHLNADSLPGKPVDVEDVNAHVARMRQALDDLANDRPVQVEDMPAGRFEADEARAAEANAIVGDWLKEAEVDGIPRAKTAVAEPVPPDVLNAARQILDIIHTDELTNYGIRVIPGENKDIINIGDVLPPSRLWDFENGRSSNEDASGTSTISIDGNDLSHVIDAIKLIGADGVSKGSYYFGDTVVLVKGDISGYGDDVGEALIRNAEVVGIWKKSTKGRSAIQPNNPRADATPAAGKPDANGGEQIDPLATSAARFAAENPDLPIVIGKNADGSDITTTPRQWLDDADATMRQAQEDVRLFEIAAGCLLGGGR